MEGKHLEELIKKVRDRKLAEHLNVMEDYVKENGHKSCYISCRLAKYYYKVEGKYHEALDILNKLAELYPDNEIVRNSIIEIYFHLQVNGEGYTDLLERKIAETLKDQPDNVNAQCLLVKFKLQQIGVFRIDKSSPCNYLLFDENIYNRCINALRAIIAAYPDNYNAPILLNKALRHQGQNEAAVNVLKESLERNPNHIDTIASLAYSLLLTGDYTEAERYAEEAYKKSEHGANAANIYAQVLGASYRYQDAENILREAIQTQPNSYSYCILAKNLFKQGKNNQALALLDEAIRRYPNNLSIIRTRNSLEERYGYVAKVYAPQPFLRQYFV